jgi:Mg2+ and Co2+ transporter CorA
MTADPIPQGPPRTSAFEDVIYWTSSLASEDIINIARDPRVLFKHTLLIVCAEWYTLVKYATTRLTQLEWELENPQLQHSVGGLEVTINKLHGWRRRFPIFRTLISEVLEKAIKRDHFTSFPDNHLSDLKRDFEIILSDIEMLQTRADRIMAVVTATMSIEESQKANDQNRSLARLTWLAVTFVPLSFTSSLFSMNGDLASLGRSFWIFCAVALPMTAIVLLITTLSDRTARTFERVGERFYGRQKQKGI